MCGIMNHNANKTDCNSNEMKDEKKYVCHEQHIKRHRNTGSENIISRKTSGTLCVPVLACACACDSKRVKIYEYIYFYELWLLFYKTEKANRKHHERTEYD